MDERVALGIAIGSALLAVGIVAADLELGLEAELQTMHDGAWLTFSKSEAHLYSEPPLRGGCASPELRLVVDNDRLISASPNVLITYWDHKASTTKTVLDETWNLERGEERAYAFTIPAEAFEPRDANQTYPETVFVDVRVGDIFLGTCVAEASA